MAQRRSIQRIYSTYFEDIELSDVNDVRDSVELFDAVDELDNCELFDAVDTGRLAGRLEFGVLSES